LATSTPEDLTLSQTPSAPQPDELKCYPMRAHHRRLQWQPRRRKKDKC